MLNRRGFISGLIGALASVPVVMELDLDKLLWVPGEKTIFLSTAEFWESDFGLITAEVLRQLENKLKFARIVNVGYMTEFSVGQKIGQTVTIRRPPNKFLPL